MSAPGRAAGGADADDARLAVLAAAGDARAFERLIGRHQDALFRLARRSVGGADSAMDVVQDALAAAWLALPRYDPGRPFGAWLWRIALNKCRDHARRRRARAFAWAAQPDDWLSDAPDPALSAEDAIIDSERLSRLDQAISQLPDRLREPLVLTVFEGLSQEEAARLLEISAKGVETRVYRARKALAAAVGHRSDNR